MEEFISTMQDFGFKYTISDRDTLTKYFYNNRKFKITGTEDICIRNEIVTIKLQEDYDEIEFEIISEDCKERFNISKECTIHYNVDKRDIVTIQIFDVFEKGCEPDMEITFRR